MSRPRCMQVEASYVGGQSRLDSDEGDREHTMMYEAEVQGRRPILFALSTCPRCQRLKQFLSSRGIDAVIVDVDLLPPQEREAHLRFVRHINPRVSFPTLVVGELAVIGEDYDGVREALGL